MEAIILAGGFGTRLRPLTFTRAKSLLPILNKPMVSFLIDAMPREVDTIILAANYRCSQIKEYVESLDIPQTVIVNEEPRPLGTGGAVKFAEKHLSERFFVLNADIISSLNLSDMLRFHTKKGAVASISLWPVENVSEFGVVQLTADGEITKFVEKPRPDQAPSNLINAGAYLLERSVLEYIETGKLISMEKEIFPRVITDTRKFYGFQFKGFWVDVGRITSYLDVTETLLKARKTSVVMGSDTTVRGTATHTSLGSNVTVGAGTTVTSSVVFDNVRIGSHVRLDRCILGEGSQVHDDAVLDHVVVGDNETVAAGTRLSNAVVWTQAIPEGYPAKQIGNVLGE